MSTIINLLLVYQLSSIISNYLQKREYKFGQYSNKENKDMKYIN